MISLFLPKDLKSEHPSASLQGRLFIGYSRNRVQLYEQDHAGNWELKIHQKITLHSNREESCCNMQLVEEDSQLWFSCGNTVLVSDLGEDVDFTIPERNHQFYVVVNKSAVVAQMIPHSDHMWCLVVDSLSTDYTSQIVQIDIANRRCARRLEFKGHEEIDYRLEAYEDRLEIVERVDQGSTDEVKGHENGDRRIYETDPYVSCFKVTDNLVWAGTRDGKILVVDVSDSNFGNVLAVFSLGNEYSQVRPLVQGETDGPVRHLALVGDDKIIACQEVRGNKSVAKGYERQSSGGSKYRLVVWDRWDMNRFEWFDKVKQSLES